MMDTRTLVIMGILIAGMLVLSTFLGPQPAVSPPTAVPETAVPAASAAPAAPAAPVADLAPPRDITITTPEYKAVIDENGGRLKSFTLLKYYRQKLRPEDANQPMELVTVSSPADWSLPLTLVRAGQEAAPLDQTRFTADQSSLTLAPGETKTLTLTSQDLDGLTIVRALTFTAGGYYVKQAVTLENQGPAAYGGQLKMRINSAPFSPRQNRYNVMGAYSNGGLETDSPEDAPETLAEFNGQRTSLDWVGYMDQYFLTAFVFPDASAPPAVNAAFQDHGGLAVDAAWPLELAAGQTATREFDFYYGPKDEKDLAAAGHHLDKSVDLGWFAFLAKPLAYLLRLFYAWVGNYGAAIILVTILIKICLWPLTAKSYRSMKEMQKLQPKVAKIREKYADDREAMNRETMRLYKTFKVSPFGGCLPMLLQIPFFIAFYRVLDYALELRGAPFMLWMQDLSAPDRLLHFSFKIPLMDLPTGIPVLTLLMGASMIWQQKMTPTMGDPAQAKIMMLMPVIFTFILINMPAGLVLYWLVNNILSIGQQKLINRNRPAASAAAAK